MRLAALPAPASCLVCGILDLLARRYLSASGGLLRLLRANLVHTGLNGIDLIRRYRVKTHTPHTRDELTRQIDPTRQINHLEEVVVARNHGC
jgi:hypothetical protein